jgi:hypothetical protein
MITNNNSNNSNNGMRLMTYYDKIIILKRLTLREIELLNFITQST